MPELDIFQKFLAAPNLKIVLLSPLIFILLYFWIIS